MRLYDKDNKILTADAQELKLWEFTIEKDL